VKFSGKVPGAGEIATIISDAAARP